MKITIMASLLAKWDMNINACQIACFIVVKVKFPIRNDNDLFCQLVGIEMDYFSIDNQTNGIKC
jgi:hypothetical protein